jgi:hypothetical protein
LIGTKVLFQVSIAFQEGKTDRFKINEIALDVESGQARVLPQDFDEGFSRYFGKLIASQK